MPNVNNLIKDIYDRLDSSVPFNENDVVAFSHNLAKKLSIRLSEEREATRLRLSNWSVPCERQLYLKVNRPEVVEKLPPNVKLKFLFGDIAEEVLLFLAKAAGHSVEGEQDELEVAGVKGHRDGIIDGRIVDVKSAAPFSFRKFTTHTLREDDAFGYLGQLGTYHAASRDDPRVTDKHTASFLVVDKVSGHLCLDSYPQYRDSQREIGLEEQINSKKAMLLSPTPPKRGFDPEPMGKSGNYKLPTACSYCPVKAACHPNLRAFAYASGPVFLTTVIETPKVPEIPVESPGE